MTAECLAAFTAFGGTYPPYINFSLDGDDVVVTIREAETQIEGVRVCGRTCHPGGAHCNNYCNMHPDKSIPMADSPLDHCFPREGKSAQMRMPVGAFWVLWRKSMNALAGKACIDVADSGA